MRILTIAKTNTPHGVRPITSLLRSGQEVLLLDETNPYPEGRPAYTYVNLPLNSPATCEVIRRVSKAFRPDVIHVHWVDYRAAAAIAAGAGPVVLSVWGTDINQWVINTPQAGASRIPDWLRATLRGAAHIIVDDATMPTKCSMLAGASVPCSQLHLGIDENLYRSPQLTTQALQLRKYFAIDEDDFLFLSPRAFSERYRHHDILKAFSRLVKNNKACLVFKTFYNNPPHDPIDYEFTIRAMAEKLGCAHRLRWVNRFPENNLPALYAACDAIVNYPIIDAFPVTFLEAMAAKRTIVSCRHEAYHKTIVESSAIFCENSVKDLSDAMWHAISLKGRPDYDLRLDRVSQQVCTQYSHSSYIGGLMKIYSSLITTPIKNLGPAQHYHKHSPRIAQDYRKS